MHPDAIARMKMLSGSSRPHDAQRAAGGAARDADDASDARTDAPAASTPADPELRTLRTRKPGR